MKKCNYRYFLLFETLNICGSLLSYPVLALFHFTKDVLHHSAVSPSSVKLSFECLSTKYASHAEVKRGDFANLIVNPM